jgi:hypothetical protein
MRQIQISDALIASELDSSGYVVVPGLDETTVKGLCRSIYEEIRFACPEKVNYNTGADLTGSVRGRAFECIASAFAPVLDRYFQSYECIVGILFVKRPSAVLAGQIQLHCDPTLLPDESRQRHINIWAPLIDVDEKNGALCLVPGAHKVFAPVHSFSVPSQFARIADTVMEYGRCVPMKAGDALIFDNRMPHFSRQNLSSFDRPAAILSIVPSESEFISLFGGAGGEFPIEVYRQPSSWYENTEWINDRERPQTGTYLGRLNWTPHAMSQDEFVDRLEIGVEIQYEFGLLRADVDTRS